MKNIIKVLMTALIATALMQSCGDEDTVRVSPRAEYKVTELLTKANYTLFVEALEIAGLKEEVDNLASSTIFAPTNDAFIVLLNQLDADNLNDVDPELLETVLRYHIVSTEYALAALPREVPTLAGAGNNVVVVRAGGVSLNGKATIGASDRFAENGVFHGVNYVLSTPEPTILDIIENDPEFSLLLAALEHTGLDVVLSGSTAYTLLAPTNDAFIDAGVTDPTTLDAEELAEVLKFHVIADKKFSTEFVSGTRYASVLGDETAGQLRITFNGTFNGSEVVTPNMIASNGVVHKVDAIIFKQYTISDAITSVYNPAGANDAAGIDPFGLIVAAAGYDLFEDYALNHDVYTHTATPSVASFGGSIEDMVAYIERQVFPGGTNIPGKANGTKVTSIGGDEYYIAKNAAGVAYVNGVRRNAFTAQTTNFPVYDGTVYLFNGAFAPLPENNIVEVLASDTDFELISKAIEVAGKTTALGAGNKTFLALDDVTFEAETGLDLAELSALDPDDEDDASTIADLGEIIDRHTVNSVYFSIVLNDRPTIANSLGEDLFFATVAGAVRIIEDLKQPDTRYVSLVSTNRLANNGVIHVVSKVIELAE